jgi:hypothetical protein
VTLDVRSLSRLKARDFDPPLLALDEVNALASGAAVKVAAMTAAARSEKVFISFLSSFL